MPVRVPCAGSHGFVVLCCVVVLLLSPPKGFLQNDVLAAIAVKYPLPTYAPDDASRGAAFVACVFFNLCDQRQPFAAVLAATCDDLANLAATVVSKVRRRRGQNVLTIPRDPDQMLPSENISLDVLEAAKSGSFNRSPDPAPNVRPHLIDARRINAEQLNQERNADRRRR